MKHKDIKALHQKTKSELLKLLESKQKEVMTTKLEKNIKKSKNTRLVRVLNDDIARINTVLQERTIKEQVKV